MVVNPQYPGLSRLNHVGIIYAGAVAELGRGAPLAFIPDNAPGLKPVRDLVQMVLFLRAENNALVKVLHDKGLLTEADLTTFQQQMNDEAEWFAEQKADYFSKLFGVRFTITDHGLNIDTDGGL